MGFNEEHAIETFKSLINLSTEGFKTLQLLNGGAVVALLAYFGQTKADPSIITRAKFPMSLFLAGLIASTLAFAFSYLTQLSLHNENIKNPEKSKILNHQLWLWVTFVICIISIALFAWGAFSCLDVFATP